MIVILFRILILIALIFLLYTSYQYFQNPIRKLKNAKTKQSFYFVDEPMNSKKNLQFVYKGCSFVGEKYLGTTDHSFDVVTIQVYTPDPSELHGLTRDDLYFLEREIVIRYPHATVEWKHPINKLVITIVD